MPIIPHAFALFDSAALLLRAEAGSSPAAATERDMDSTEALAYIEAIGRFAAEDRREGGNAFARPLSISLLGGEPLADLTALDALLRATAAHGIAAEVGTTAAWVEDMAQAEQVLESIRDRVHCLRLDTSSQITGPDLHPQIELLLTAARRVGMTVDVHCRVAPTVPLDRRLLALEAINNGSSFVHVDPAYDLLVDTRQPDDDVGFFLTSPSRRRCAEKFGFFVAPGGSVYPCAAGVGFAALCIGDLSTQGAGDIVAAARRDPRLMRLREQGPCGLDTELLGVAAGEMSGRYADNCDFHRQVLTRAAASAPTREPVP